MIKIPAHAGTHRIDRRIYGQFAEHLGRCIYEGIWVGEDSPIPNRNGIRSDVVAALRAIRVPLVRWPGGCFADAYHWQQGVGPRTERVTMINTHWGGVVESNQFGTHEYFELLNQLDAEAYITGNVGSGSVAEMRDWVEYITLDGTSPMADLRKRHGREQPWRLEFFGVGNESWGCGGNMLPLHYANLYRQFQTYVRQHGEHPIYKVAGGANSDDYDWTDVLMATAGKLMDGLSVHYYTLPTDDWSVKGAATGFDEAQWHSTINGALRMDALLTRHSQIMDQYDPDKRVGLIVDEWGTWCDVEPGTNPGFLYQQNTVRDAVTAALSFNIFHRHAARVRMANIAQMVNVLQALLLTDGAAMLRTPTYHAFDLYTDHHDATFVATQVEQGDGAEAVDHTVSYKDGAYSVSLVNTDPSTPAEVSVEFPAAIAEVTRARLLTGERIDSHNTFANPDEVRPVDLHDCRVTGDRVNVALPPHSVATLRIVAHDDGAGPGQRDDRS